MTNEELIRAVIAVSVETGSLVCIGCVHEDNCGIHGCAILREAATVLEAQSAQLAAKDAEIERMRQIFKDSMAGLTISHDNLSADLARVAAERDVAIKTLSDMRFAYINKDIDCPHQFETEALAHTDKLLGKWRTPAKQDEEG